MKHAALRVTRKEQQNCTLVSLDGEMNESFDPAAFTGLRGVVVFDLDGVKRFTSHGVLQWITALGNCPASYYCFINCRPCAMDQFNLVHAFPQRGELVSFYTNFVCVECGHEVERLIDLRRQLEIQETLALPEVECPKCQARAELDEVPELYFKYVLSAPPPRPPPAAEAVIGRDSDGAAPARRFQMEKDVEQSITAFWLSGYLDQRAYFKRAAEGVQGLPLVEVSDLEGIADAALDGFRKFLAALDQEAVMARVTAPLVPALEKVLQGWRKPKIKIVSFLVPLRCTACETVFGADLTADRLPRLLVSRESAELCPRCAHPLEPQWTAELAETAGRLPTAAPSPEVQAYLLARPPRGRMLADDRLLIQPQRLLLGKYEVLYPIGRGGMGEVFLARQHGPESFEKLVVLKRIRRDRIGDQHSRDLFLKEARVAARLSHHNIVQIFDLERIDDEYLISMEYVNGIDLASALQLSRQLALLWPVEICCRVLSELCSGLHAAHTYQEADGRVAPIIHRDVSPSNILLSTEGAVKLADFGIASVAGDPTEDAAGFGKAGYAAPEQLDGALGPTSDRTDIYAAGVVLYECLTLRPISQTPTMQSSPPAAGGARPHSPPQICVSRKAPPLLQDVFERATQPDPSQRYRSARDFGRDLERIGRLVSEVTNHDLALWVRRLVALRLEAEGHEAPPIITMQHTGSMSGPVAIRERRSSGDYGRKP